jgi:hypothetical protein
LLSLPPTASQVTHFATETNILLDMAGFHLRYFGCEQCFFDVDYQRWDEKLEQDIADGKLEALAEEAKLARRSLSDVSRSRSLNSKQVIVGKFECITQHMDKSFQFHSSRTVRYRCRQWYNHTYYV